MVELPLSPRFAGNPEMSEVKTDFGAREFVEQLENEGVDALLTVAVHLQGDSNQIVVRAGMTDYLPDGNEDNEEKRVFLYGRLMEAAHSILSEYADVKGKKLLVVDKEDGENTEDVLH